MNTVPEISGLIIHWSIIRFAGMCLSSKKLTNVARLAELFGCRGYRVDQPGSFDETFREALTTGAPCVIDVIMDPDARPPRIAASREAR